MKGVDYGEIYYVQGRLDPKTYWPRTPAQKREAKERCAAFFMLSPFNAAQAVGVEAAIELRKGNK